MNLMHPIFGIGRKMFSGYDIPPQEVAELYKLYTQTGGPSWIDHTNWFANKQCATWYGLIVAGGRVTQIQLSNNNLAGMTSFSPKSFAALMNLNAYKDTSNETLSMRFSLADLPATMRSMGLRSTPSLITGTMADLPATMQGLSMNDTQSLITGGASAMAAIAIDDIQLGSMANQTIAAKDDIINRLYADRALFTLAAHNLNISGGEGPLTGVYQTSAAPSTPAEKAYALVNDPNGEEFLKWAITL